MSEARLAEAESGRDLAVAGLFLGILALVSSPFLIGLPLGALALVASLIHLRRPGCRYRYKAIWGAATAVLGMAASVGAGYGYYRLVRHLIPIRAEARSQDTGKRWRGTAAPPLKVTTIGGETIELASLRGRRVLVDFWATWCGPCVQAIPDLNRLAKEWPDDLVIIGITGEDREHVKGFMTRKPIDYQVVSDLDHESLPSPFRDVQGLPTMFFIDRDGIIRSVIVGYHDYDALEARQWVAAAGELWAKHDRDQALKLAARALEVQIDASVERELLSVFESDPGYAALHDRVQSRIEDLLQHYERKYDRQLGRDRSSVLWTIWSLGAERKDAQAVPQLARYLEESALEEARWRAADALWQIGDARAVPHLIAALQDPSIKVAGFAASGLGDLGDASAVEPLLELFQRLSDNREEAKARVADALGKLGDKRAIAPIAASLAAIEEPAYVRWARPALHRLEEPALHRLEEDARRF